VNYGKRRVLKGLSVRIAAGEIFGLLGPNGAGKTTLIRSICGRIKQASGTISIEGRSVADRRSLYRIGLVPQEIALYQHLTARENLEIMARLNGLSRRQTTEAVEFAVEACRLARQADDKVHALSGGWKRRVNIAAAILHRPSLLILDEPTVGVDIEARNALHEVIRNLRDEGMAMLLATHDMDQAEILCNFVGFLRDGVLSPKGSPSQLLEAIFEGQEEVVLQLREKAPPQISAIFGKLGFHGAADSLERRRLIELTQEGQVRLSRTLKDERLGIREISFRKPGLETMFLRLEDSETAQ